MTTTVLAYIPSPDQGVWHLGPLPLRAYAVFIIVGIVVALVIGDRRWEARGGERGVVYDIAPWAVTFGLIGGRLYHVITDWKTYFGDGGAGPLAALRVMDGGLGIWGAVALGGVGAWIGCRRRGIPLPAFGDAIAPGIMLAQAIGRLGNYFNQELYGRATTLPWGLEIYERRDASGALDALNGFSTGQLLEVVHPTFLYELLWNILVFVVLILVDRRFKIGHGRLFALYVAGYCLGRFWIELMRSDMATHIAGIRINSFTSMFVFIGAVVYIMAAPKGREDPATLRGKPEELVGEEEGTSVEEFVKELAGVASTTGVVAAAKVAGQAEDERAKAAGDEVEAVSEAEALTADVAEAPFEEIAEAEEFAAAGDAAEVWSEASAEGEAQVEDVAEAPSEDIAKAEEFAEAGDAAEGSAAEAELAEPETESAQEVEEPVEAGETAEGLGPVEGQEAVEAAEAAAQVHQAAVEGADEAEVVATEVAAEAPEAAQVEAEAVDEVEEPVEEGGSGGDVGGLGLVEGEEAVEAGEAAAQVHEAAVEGADEAEAVAAEVAAEEPEVAQVEAEAVDEVGEPVEEGEAEALEEGEPEAAEPEAADAAEEAEPAGDNAAGRAEGLGIVKGEEAAEAQEAAQDVHENAVEESESVGEPSEASSNEIAAAGAEVSESEGSGPESEVEQATSPTDGELGEAAEHAGQAGEPRRRWWRRRH